MSSRQWWPTAGNFKVQSTNTALENGVTDPAVSCLRPHEAQSQRGTSAQVVNPALTVPDSETVCQEPVPENPLLQLNSGALDWQTMLLQKLLPKSNISAAQRQSAAPSQAQSSPTVTVGPAAGPQSEASSTTCRQSSVLLPEDPPFLYAGILLDPLSIARLLSWASPRHSKLSADHLTLIYRPSKEQVEGLTLGLEVQLQVLGKAQDVATQVPSTIITNI